MSTRFFTNEGEQTLFRKLKGVFESNPDLQWFDAVVGYRRNIMTLPWVERTSLAKQAGVLALINEAMNRVHELDRKLSAVKWSDQGQNKTGEESAKNERSRL